MALLIGRKKKETEKNRRIEELLQFMFSSDEMKKVDVDFPANMKETDTQKNTIYPVLRIPAGYEKKMEKVFRKGMQGIAVEYLLTGEDGVILVEGEGNLQCPSSYWSMVKKMLYKITIDDVQYQKELRSMI